MREKTFQPAGRFNLRQAECGAFGKNPHLSQIAKGFVHSQHVIADGIAGGDAWRDDCDAQDFFSRTEWCGSSASR